MKLRAQWATVGVVVLVAALVRQAEAVNRTITGLNNNLMPGRASWGAAETDVIRFGYPADYPDGFGDQIYGSPTRPNARDVSNALSAQSSPVYNNRQLSDWIVQWGQFLTHDMDHTGTDAANNVLSTGTTGDFNIAINDPNDPLGPSPILFNRSNYDPTTGNTALVPVPVGPPRPNWREQINSITSYIDASNVYGSDATRAAALRTFSGGKLVTTAGGLLPGYNTAGFENDDPLGEGSALFLAGDVRANEQVGLTATHALFLREHNRLTDVLHAQNPALGDEQLYQAARKIVGAEMQIITYKEFLPALLGPSAPTAEAYHYNPSLDPSITNSFATAFFRYGHSMQSAAIPLVDNVGSSEGSLSLRDAFFNPNILGDSPENVEYVLKGLASQVSQENDVLMVDDLRNFLFGPPGAGGVDLAALDVQRGRDHGLLDYNAFRPAYGLARLNSINQLTSDPALRAKLVALYGNINSIDAWVGGIAEDHVAGSSVGAMVMASLVDQFTRLRDGDRLFYLGDPDLQTAMFKAAIDLSSVTLSEIIRLNTGITNLQSNVFFAASAGIAGDFNLDGVVDAADYTVWRSTLNQSTAPFAGADANGDGLVTQADYLVWKSNYGHTLGAGAASSLAAVPEPSSGLVLAAATALAAAFCRRASIASIDR
jgi:peroxidase